MNMLLDTKPGDVLIDEMQLRLDGNAVIRGKAKTPSSVTQFISALKSHGDLVYEATQSDIHDEYDIRFGNNVPVWEFVLLVKTPMRQGRVRTVGTNPMTQREMQAELARERAPRRRF